MACANPQFLYGYANVPAWDASYSLPDDPLSDDFYLTFEASLGSLGTVVGVTTEDLIANYIDIQYAIHFRQNKVSVVENGNPRTAWIDNDGRWEYTISRLGSTVYYTRRDVLVPAAVVFDIRAPGVPILGELLYVSAAPSYGAMIIDSSYYAVGDSACLISWGNTFVAPEYTELVTVHGSIEGLLPLNLRAAAGVGDSSAIFDGNLPLAGSGSSTSGASVGVYNGTLQLYGWGSEETYNTRLRGYLAFDGAGVGTIAVAQSNEARMSGYFLLDGGGYTDEAVGTGLYDGLLPLEGAGAGRPSLDSELQAVAHWGLPLVLHGAISAQYSNFMRIILPDFIAFDRRAVEITEEIRVSMAMDCQHAVLVREFFNIVSTPNTFTQNATMLLDIAKAVDTALPAFSLWVQETLSIDDVVSATQVVRLADRLLALGMVQTYYHGVIAVLSSVLAFDRAYFSVSESILDEVDVDESSDTVVTRLAQLLDVIGISTEFQNILTIVVEETAALQAADSVELTAQLFAELIDDVDVFSFLKTPADVVQGWVMNTEGALPISEYDNFLFNSLTQFDGQLYGTNDAGLYALTGDTDAGTEIAAQLKSMMLDFGTSRLKRMRSAYLGYTSTGDLVLKVRSVDDGQLSEHWYKACPVAADAPRTSRVLVGQGLRSRYWQFELVNVNGADFEIDHLEMHPLITNRRI